MAPTPIRSVNDGARLTVNMMIKTPTLIPARILDIMDQQFLADALLRKANAVPSGVLEYFESTPLYADTAEDVVEEFGEIPTALTSMGTPKVARVQKKALAVLVSREMIDRNDVDRVNVQIQQVKNTLVRAWDTAFMNVLLAAAPTLAATAAWSSAASAKIRHDLAAAMQVISDASPTSSTDDAFGFEADTLVISTTTRTDFLDSDNVNQVFAGGDIASESLRYTGKMPKKFFGLDVVTSRRCPAGKAIVLQRGTVGGISDERPLSSTPLYEKKENESWRSDTTRASAVFVDQPKAVCVITGV